MKQFQKNRMTFIKRLRKPSVKATFWIAGLLIIWEIASRLGITPSYILPPFSKVCITLWQELLFGNLLVMVGRSLLSLIQALVFGLVLSSAIIILCTKSKTFSSFYNTIAVMMNSIPSMALLPLIIMWFGIGNLAIIVLIMHSILWTFTIYALEGIKAVPAVYREFSDNININLSKRLTDVYLPAMLPNIVSGMKIAWSRAWRSLIGAEIVFGAIGAAGGLGYYININRLNGDMSKVIAGVAIVAIIGIIVDLGIFNRLNARMKKWGLTHE